jgi:large conductance mechanosensitive channel
MRSFFSRVAETLSTARVGVIVVAVALGSGVWELCLDIAYDIVTPLLSATFGTALRHKTFHIGHGEDLIQNELFVGRVLGTVLALVLALLVAVWLLPRMWHKDELEMRACPFCLGDVPLEALKCAHCASDLPVED